MLPYCGKVGTVSAKTAHGSPFSFTLSIHVETCRIMSGWICLRKIQYVLYNEYYNIC